jgi:DNA-binding GntR family transcriptional regulator
VLAARKPDPELLHQLRNSVEQYEASVKAKDWMRAVNNDFQFHGLLIRFHRNRRLESFYQKVIGELRMGMVLVDRRHDDPEGLVPVHRKMFQLLTSGKLKQCAAVLEQHLADSESRLSRVMTTQRERNAALTT